MSFEAGALISLPAIELQNAKIPASLFDANALNPGEFSTPLRNAVVLLEECLLGPAPTMIVARPEIFTDGVTLAWLRANSSGIQDHVCLSDGSTIRLIPGFRNHVFFYALGSTRHFEALARLDQRTPEIFTQVHSQINSALKFSWKKRWVAPQTYLFLSNSDASPRESEMRSLVINRHSVDDSVARTLQTPPASFPPSQFAELTCIRMTESRLGSIEQSKRVLSRIAASLLDPKHGIVLILPYANGHDDSLPARLRLIIGSLFSGGGRIPIAAAANLFVATADLPLEALRASVGVKRLVIDDVAEFWREPPSYYKEFDEITVYAHRKYHIGAQFQELSRQVYGPRARIEWLDAPRGYGSRP